MSQIGNVPRQTRLLGSGLVDLPSFDAPARPAVAVPEEPRELGGKAALPDLRVGVSGRSSSLGLEDSPPPVDGVRPERSAVAARPSSGGTIEGVLDFAKSRTDEAEGKKELAAAAPPKKKKKKGLFGKIGDFFKRAVGAVANAFKAVGNFLKKIGPILMTVASVAAMVVPGLQPLGVALMAVQGVQSGVKMVKGIAAGDWKAALQGAIGVATAFAGGVAAGGAKMFSQGVLKAAETVGKVAGTLQKGVAVMDAVQSGSPSAIVGAAASFAGSTLKTAQVGSETLAENLEKYGKDAARFADALASKRWGEALATAAGTAAGAVAKDNERLADSLRDLERVSAGGQGLADALKGKDGLDVIEAAANFLNQTGDALGAGERFQNVTRDVGQVAGEARGIRTVARSGDIGGAATRATALGAEVGRKVKADEKTQGVLDQLDKDVTAAVKALDEALSPPPRS